jgi:hypothetical protein
MQYRPLGNTGLSLPALSFGASSLGQEFRQVDLQEAIRSVRTALTTRGDRRPPVIATWTRPSTVPYLNLFCDQRTIRCNSPTTLNFVNGTRFLDDIFTTDERGARFDGPLFDVPAGQVKAAIGGTYTSFDVIAHRGNNSGTTNLILNPFVDAEPYRSFCRGRFFGKNVDNISRQSCSMQNVDERARGQYPSGPRFNQNCISSHERLEGLNGRQKQWVVARRNDQDEPVRIASNFARNSAEPERASTPTEPTRP